MWVDRDFRPVPEERLGGALTHPNGAQHPNGAPYGAPSSGLLAGGPPTGESPFAVQPGGTVAHWQGARRRGETGLEAAEGALAFALYEVPAVPDFSSARFPDLADLDAKERAGRVAEGQARLLTALHALGPRIGLSLRYLCQRPPGVGTHGGGEARVRCFLVGRALGTTAEDASDELARFEDALRRGMPPGYPLRRCDPGRDADLAGTVLFPQDVRALCEVVKPEQALPAWHARDLCGFSFYYHPVAFAPAGDNDMTAFCRALTAEVAGTSRGVFPGTSVLVDVTLVPAAPLTHVEREELASWSALAEKWGRDQKLQVPGGLYSAPTVVEVAADPQAGEARKAYQDLAARYGSPQARPFLYAVRVLALGDDQHGTQSGTQNGRNAAVSPRDTAVSLAAALSSRALAPGAGQQLLALTPEHPAFARAVRSVHGGYVTAAVCNERLWGHADAPETLRRLHRLAALPEVAPFFRLPIPGRDGCPGIPLDGGMPQTAAPTTATAARPEILVGRFLDGARVTSEAATIRLSDLSKHCLVVGTPGSGKTSLSFSLLTQLWRDHGIPFLALEPAKTEYRSLFDVPGVGDDLLVFTVGGERVSPFRLNPFEVLEGVPVAEHVSALTACFQGAFSLPDPLPMLLDEALREVYADRGWSEYGAGGDDPDLVPPTMRDFYLAAVRAAGRSRYRGDVAGNIRAALETRLGALLRGPKGRCFGARRSVPFPLLMGRPVVLELEPLSDEEKALAMMLVLTFVREHARATRRSGAKLTHVVLVEEAHNLLGAENSGGKSASPDGGDPKAVAVRQFVRMLAEMRALGEGLLIADQLPTALAAEAVKNTNVKVMHRLTALDDRQALGATMVLDAGQTEQAATLPPGVSLVFQEGWPRARTVLEPDFKGQNGLEEPPDDRQVRERMEGFPGTGPEVAAAFLPFADCGAVCPSGRCDSLLRERTERLARRSLPLVEAAVAGRAKGEDACAAATVAFTEELSSAGVEPGDRLANGCALIHFAELVYPQAMQQAVQGTSAAGSAENDRPR